MASVSKDMEGLQREDDDLLNYILTLKGTLEWDNPKAIISLTGNILNTIAASANETDTDSLKFANNQSASKEIERLFGVIGYVLHSSIYSRANTCYEQAMLDCVETVPETITSQEWYTYGAAVIRSERTDNLPAGYIHERLRSDSELLVEEDVQRQLVASYKLIFMALVLNTNDDEFVDRLEGKYSSHVVQTLIAVAPIIIGTEALFGGQPTPERSAKMRKSSKNDKSCRVNDDDDPSTLSLILKFYKRIENIIGIVKGFITDRISYIMRSLFHVVSGYHPFQSAIDLMERTSSTRPVGNRKKNIQNKGKARKNASVDNIPEERSVIWHPELRDCYDSIIKSVSKSTEDKGQLSKFFVEKLGPPVFKFILKVLNDKDKSSHTTKDEMTHQSSIFVKNVLKLRKKSKHMKEWGELMDKALDSDDGAYHALEAAIENADEDLFIKLYVNYFNKKRLRSFAADDKGNYVVQKLIKVIGTLTENKEQYLTDLLELLRTSFTDMLMGDRANVILRLVETVGSTGNIRLQNEMSRLVLESFNLTPSKKESQVVGWLCFLSLKNKDDMINHLDKTQQLLKEEESDAIKLEGDQKYCKTALSIPYTVTGMNLIVAMLKYEKPWFLRVSYNEFTKWRKVIDQLGRDVSGCWFLETLIKESKIWPCFQDPKKGCDISKLLRVVKELMNGWWQHPRASFVIGSAFNRCDVDESGLKLREELIKSLIPNHTDECKGKDGCRICPSMRSRIAEVHKRNTRLYELMGVSLYRSSPDNWRKYWLASSNINTNIDIN